MRPFPPVAIPPFLIALAIAVLSVTITPQPCSAQQGPQWVYLDESPAGTPASVELMKDDSSTQVTRLILTIHGFWVEPLIGPDKRTYHRYQFPGLGQIAQAGAPEFPEMHFRIAVPSTAKELTVRSAKVVKERFYKDILPYPQPIPEGDAEGRPEEWRYDPKVYETSQIFPHEAFPNTVGLNRFMAFIPSADLVVNPVQWNPVTRELRIIVVFDLAYDHEGSVPKYEMMTKHRARMASSLFDNWPVVENAFPVDTTEYIGSFLFISPVSYQDSLQALADQKRARGFHVTEYYIPEQGNTCASIRDIIRTWYDVVEWRGDAYVMLIGDSGVIPLCPVGTIYNDTVYTDDLYASPIGDDLDEEVFLGRLAVDDEVDLGNQVRKILRYENEVRWVGEYRDALLIAHLQGAPGKYEGAMEDVRTATYSTPPSFLTCYGSDGDDDSDIDDAIEKDVGVVAYRGHAYEYAWTNWNGYDSYGTTDVANLSNGAMTPVVWAFTCSSGDIREPNCLGEHFMMEPEGRGVAYYGATNPSDTNPNHHLTRNLFKRVYDEDLTIHSHAIMMAEEFMVDETYEDNAWMYLLLGDPEMTIRRRAPGEMMMVLPDRVPLCDAAPCYLDVKVMDDLGRPIPDLIVSAWMPTPAPKKASSSDEVLSNRYSDSEGKVHLPAEPQSEGWILVTARDDFGRVISDAVEVVTATSTPVVRAPLILSPRPAVMSERTTFYFGRALSSSFRLEIYDQRGRLVRRIAGSSGPDHMLWDGRDGAGRTVGSGVYMVRLITENTRLSTKVVRVR